MPLAGRQGFVLYDCVILNEAPPISGGQWVLNNSDVVKSFLFLPGTFIIVCFMYFLILHAQRWEWKLIALGASPWQTIPLLLNNIFTNEAGSPGCSSVVLVSYSSWVCPEVLLETKQGLLPLNLGLGFRYDLFKSSLSEAVESTWNSQFSVWVAQPKMLFWFLVCMFLGAKGLIFWKTEHIWSFSWFVVPFWPLLLVSSKE